MQKTLQTGLGIPEKLGLPSGKYEVKFAVRDNSSGLLGTVSIPIELKQTTVLFASAFLGTNRGGITSGLPVTRSEWQIRGIFLTQAIARAGPSHNYHVELLYQRKTRSARSVFQRLALPTPVSISNGICSG